MALGSRQTQLNNLMHRFLGVPLIDTDDPDNIFRILRTHIGASSPRDILRLSDVFDVKQDLRCKACLVAGGHRTPIPEDPVYSSVAALRSLRIATFLVAFVAAVASAEVYTTHRGPGHQKQSLLVDCNEPHSGVLFESSRDGVVMVQISINVVSDSDIVALRFWHIAWEYFISLPLGMCRV